MKKNTKNSIVYLIVIIIAAGLVAYNVTNQPSVPNPSLPELKPAKTPAKTWTAPVIPKPAPAVSSTPQSTVQATVVSPAPTVSLLTPNGNFWKRNTLNTIIFRVSGTQTVSIFLDVVCAPGFTCNAPAPQNGHYTIAKDVPAVDGQYNWFTGKTLECGMGDSPSCQLINNQKYAMRLCSSSDAKICSTREFTIVP